MKEFHILAIDGGGSKGLMEALILQDVMNATTVLKQNPDRVLEILQSGKEMFGLEEARQEFIKEMLMVEDQKAIHPTEVFDMIVGTSVGGMMAFGLVGGKVDQNEERVPMTLQEVVKFMYDTTEEIFSCCGRCIACWKTIATCKFHFHSSKGVKNALQKTFGDAKLNSFKNPCIAAAVARRFGCNDQDEEEKYDCLEIFDKLRTPNKLVTDVLKATSNAPIYFQTPTMINNIPYVDGGLGGNCPMPQGFRRMKELRKRSKLGSGLSIAPPRNVVHSQPNGLIFWAKYLTGSPTDGMSSYAEYKKQHPRGTNQRIFPRCEDAKKFKTDDRRVDEMMECMAKERSHDPEYLQEIVSAAIVIAARVKDIDVAKLWPVAKVFATWSLPRGSPQGKLEQHLDNELAILKAMSKLKLDKTSPMKHDILLTLARSQCEGDLYDEAKETLKKVDLENDDVDKDLKEMMNYLQQSQIKKVKEGGNFVNSRLDSSSDSDSDSD